MIVGKVDWGLVIIAVVLFVAFFWPYLSKIVARVAN